MSKDIQMKELIAEFDKSGKSRINFCNDAGIGIHKFKYWENKLRVAEQPPSGFLAVQTKRSESRSDIELEYPNGVKLRLKNDAGLELLKSLINLL